MQYTKKDLSLQETDDPKTEEICKLICIEEGVIDPDQVVTSFPKKCLKNQFIMHIGNTDCLWLERY